MRKKNFGAAFHADFRQIPSLRSEPASMQKESKSEYCVFKRKSRAPEFIV